MQAKYLWLLLPPALALVLFLGPFHSTEPAANAGSPATAGTASSPSSPTLEQVASTLIGVLLLGGVIVLGMSRWRGQKLAGSGGICSVRQSLRLSGRHGIHVIEFDGRLLLLGECEGNVQILHTSSAESGLDLEEGPERADGDDDDEQGATPRDLLIPRPPAPAARNQTARKASAGSEAARKLADFQALLKLARSGGRGR